MNSNWNQPDLLLNKTLTADDMAEEAKFITENGYMY